MDNLLSKKGKRPKPGKYLLKFHPRRPRRRRDETPEERAAAARAAHLSLFPAGSVKIVQKTRAELGLDDPKSDNDD